MDIKFYSTYGTYGCFSNFSKHSILYNNKLYPTSEHLYQSLKFLDEQTKEKIRQCKTASKAAEEGRDPNKKLRDDWESAKLDVMRDVIRMKIEQHSDIKYLLKSTGDNNIIEDSPKDDYWGIGKNGSGENWLGKIWMEIREEIRLK